MAARGGYRLIPARAGNIGGHQSFAWPVAAHPRSRGEHAWNDFLTRR